MIAIDELTRALEREFDFYSARDLLDLLLEQNELQQATSFSTQHLLKLMNAAVLNEFPPGIGRRLAQALRLASPELTRPGYIRKTAKPGKPLPDEAAAQAKADEEARKAEEARAAAEAARVEAEKAAKDAREAALEEVRQLERERRIKRRLEEEQAEAATVKKVEAQAEAAEESADDDAEIKRKERERILAERVTRRMQAEQTEAAEEQQEAEEALGRPLTREERRKLREDRLKERLKQRLEAEGVPATEAETRASSEAATVTPVEPGEEDPEAARARAREERRKAREAMLAKRTQEAGGESAAGETPAEAPKAEAAPAGAEEDDELEAKRKALEERRRAREARLQRRLGAGEEGATTETPPTPAETKARPPAPADEGQDDGGGSARTRVASEREERRKALEARRAQRGGGAEEEKAEKPSERGETAVPNPVESAAAKAEPARATPPKPGSGTPAPVDETDFQVVRAAGASLTVVPNRPILIVAPRNGVLHWGVNGWKVPPSGYEPPGTIVAPDGVARRTTLVEREVEGKSRPVAILRPLASAPSIKEINFTFEFDGGKWWGREGSLKAE